MLICPHHEVPSKALAQNFLSIGATLVSAVYEVDPPLIPGANLINKKSFIRALVWEYVGCVTLFIDIQGGNRR